MPASVFPRLRLLPLAALTALLLAGCRPASPDARPEYPIRGEVVGLLRERGTLLVHHEEIPGYMPAMTMEFSVGEADLGSFREGQRITARMIEGEPGEFRLEGIRIVDAMADQQVEAAARELRQETIIRGNQAYREVGEPAPHFVLYNQEGQAVAFNRFRGKRVVLNFIFTRCPVATMCPAATQRMVRLQRLARERGIENFELLSITLDPAYDTPPVLRAYAASYGIDSSNFTFLTGPETAIRDLLTNFGVIAEPGEGIWRHTLATVLIGSDGRILHRIDGSQWDPEDFLGRL